MRWDSVWSYVIGGAQQGFEGGPECYAYMTFLHHAVEFCAYNAFFIPLMFWLVRSARGGAPVKWKNGSVNRWDRSLGWFLLAVFLIEVAYKVVSHKVLFLLQPCHVVTAIQIWALLDRGKVATITFTLSLAWQFGVIMVFVFPDVSGLQLPGEVVQFWVQHFLIAWVVPLHLVVSRPGILSLWRSHWTMRWIAFCTLALFHFSVLEPLSVLTLVNLNFLLCPPELHPVGPNRLISVPHKFWRLGTVVVVLITSLTGAEVYFVVYALLRRFRRLFGSQSKTTHTD